MDDHVEDLFDRGLGYFNIDLYAEAINRKAIDEYDEAFAMALESVMTDPDAKLHHALGDTL